MPRSRPATGAKASPNSAADHHRADAPRAAAAARARPGLGASCAVTGQHGVAHAPPTSRKKACASDSWPAWPTSSVSPIAADHADHHVLRQLQIAGPVADAAPAAAAGPASSSTRRDDLEPARARRRPPGVRRRGTARASAGASVSDTTELPRPEQPRRSHDQHQQHHQEHGTLGELERDVLRGQRLGQPDDDPADDRARRGVEPAEDGRREGDRTRSRACPGPARRRRSPGWP